MVGGDDWDDFESKGHLWEAVAHLDAVTSRCASPDSIDGLVLIWVDDRDCETVSDGLAAQIRRLARALTDLADQLSPPQARIALEVGDYFDGDGRYQRTHPDVVGLRYCVSSNEFAERCGRPGRWLPRHVTIALDNPPDLEPGELARRVSEAKADDERIRTELERSLRNG